jgi:hypothetical protein
MKTIEKRNLGIIDNSAAELVEKIIKEVYEITQQYPYILIGDIVVYPEIIEEDCGNYANLILEFPRYETEEEERERLEEEKRKVEETMRKLESILKQYPEQSKEIIEKWQTK